MKVQNFKRSLKTYYANICFCYFFNSKILERIGSDSVCTNKNNAKVRNNTYLWNFFYFVPLFLSETILYR